MRWILTALLPVFFLFPQVASAQSVGEQFDDIQDQGIIYANICSSASAECECRDEGICTLDDILQVVANVMVFILAISGSLVLLMFLFGGITWMTANGRPEKISNGKMTMVRAVVGLMIVFSSYAVIALVISILKTGEPASDGQTIEEILGEGADAIIETSTE